MSAQDELSVATSLPRSWEQERTFHDTLYDWMGRAPWLAISAAAHVVVILVLMAVPWELLRQERATIITSDVEQQLEDAFDEPPPEEEPPVEDVDTEEPVVRDVDEPVPSESDDDQEFAESIGDPSFDSFATFEAMSDNDVIGVGYGAGGAFGGRFGGDRDLRGSGGNGTQESVRTALEWLAKHQSPEGYWDCDGFMDNNALGRRSAADGPGQAVHDVGMTGLALLAFLGDGSTTRRGPYRAQVAKGVAWLKEQQDPDLGLLGERVGHGFMYNHSIATLALCEAYYFDKSPRIKRAAQDAVSFLTRARNPYSAWRYDYPPTGESDSSVTGWCVFALKSAEEGGLVVDRAAYDGALSFFDEVTDANGRTGYASVGSLSSRITGVNDHFPAESGESMTAVALLCRFFMGQVPETHEIMVKQADLLAAKLPEWDPDGLRNDMYYWYYGSYAMYQMGGKRWWEKWNSAMKRALVDSQRRDGDFEGSWDPRDVWGEHAGGRVYATALGVLCLEVYYRYSRVLGAR